MRFCLVCMAGLALATVSLAEDRPATRIGSPPMLVMAQMGGKGEVVFSIVACEVVVVDKGGKKETVQRTKLFPHAVKLDDKSLRAFGADGKALSAGDVAKRLAKSSPVAIFSTDPPDPYYLSFLREDVTVFAGPPQLFTPRGLVPQFVK